MKNIKSILLFTGLAVALISCSSDSSDSAGEDGAEAAESVMTTEEFIIEANELGQEKFDEKYPSDSKITLEGEVRAPATWDNRIAAKFGSGLNDLPLSADFMFEANGGSKESTKEKVKGGTRITFTGTIGGSFYMDGKFKRVSFSDCVAE